MRARQPDNTGLTRHAGVEVGYEVFGTGEPTLLLLPTWTIVHSRFWKAQVPYLARHFRVVTFDGPGNGRADRPTDPAAYAQHAAVARAVDVLDATDTDRAVVLALSRAADWALQLAADHPDRVLGTVFIGASLELAPLPPERRRAYARFLEPYDGGQGWQKFNAGFLAAST